MAEEIAHSVICGGDLLFNNKIDTIVKRKLELRAKNYCYLLVLPVKHLIRALQQEMSTFDIAEEFCVTEILVKEAIESYKVKGLIPEHCYSDDYYI